MSRMRVFEVEIIGERGDTEVNSSITVNYVINRYMPVVPLLPAAVTSPSPVA